MSFYDTIPGFRYWDTRAWKEYVEKNVSSIYKTTSTLLEFRQEISKHIGKPLSEIPKELVKFFVGGIDENGIKEKALARLTWLMYGVGVHTREFSRMLKSDPEVAFEVTQINAIEEKNVSFLDFLEVTNDLSAEILDTIGIEKPQPLEIQGILEEPNKLLEVLRELYTACAGFSVNHNYYTFFILSTRSIHWRYLKAAYPRLEENFSELKEFLGLDKLFEPQGGSERFREAYTIWTHSPKNLADNLYKLQDIIWNAFNFSTNEAWINFQKIKPKKMREIFEYAVKEPKDLKSEYVEFAKNTLKKLNTETSPELTDLLEYELVVEIDGPFIAKCYTSDYSKERRNIPLPEFLNTIAPWLFLGLARIEAINDTTLKYIPLET